MQMHENVRLFLNNALSDRIKFFTPCAMIRNGLSHRHYSFKSRAHSS